MADEVNSVPAVPVKPPGPHPPHEPGWPHPGHEHCYPPPGGCAPDPHDPSYWAQPGQFPYPPEPCPPPPPDPALGCAGRGKAGSGREGQGSTEKCSVVPPPIPPVRYIPGMDVQEQLTHMADHVNVCIDRWNTIQAKCYDALNKMVGAAVSNDVYYEPDEVRFSSGYSTADGADYQIIEARPVDRAGRPIRARLVTAFGSGNPAVRQSIQDASFVNSGNAVITAVNPNGVNFAGMEGAPTETVQWAGLCLIGGNPQPTCNAPDGSWLVGFTRQGVLRLLPATETTIEKACQNQIVDCIGPVLPLIMHGKPTPVAQAQPVTPGAMQVIGQKQCNGNLVFFSCGLEDNPGCSIMNVARMLISMGVTTAAVTCYNTEYGKPQSQGYVNDDAAETVDVQADTPQDDPLSGNMLLGLTGGMSYIGSLSNVPLNYQIPMNGAFWVITKRPPRMGWPNRWTGEMADICQKLGMNANDLQSVQGKLDVEQKQILNLQVRVSKLEITVEEHGQTLQNHETRITSLEGRMDTAEADIDKLQTDLSQEVQDRIAGDQAITDRLNQEIQERIDEDNKVRNDVNLIRTALTEEITARNQADTDLSNAIRNEANSRMAADTLINSRIDQLEAQNQLDLANEIKAREEGDENLQKQIDELQSDLKDIDIKPGVGLSSREVTGEDGSKTTLFDVNIGPGLRFNAAGQIAVRTGPGIGLVNGQVVPILSDCFEINEKGEIDMACCSSGNEKQPEAGIGLSYTANPETGAPILNVDPPKNGEIGGVKAGNGVTIGADGTISVNGGGTGPSPDPYTLPPATKTTLGGVIVGENLEVDANGKVSAPAPYQLPIASPSVIGGVRVGTNLTIDENGVLNANIPDLPQREGDTVLAGTGIDVVKDGNVGTATVSLDETTQATLTQVGENKDAIDGNRANIAALSTSKADRTELENTANALTAEANTRKAADDAMDAEIAALQQSVSNIADTAAKALPTTGGKMTGDIDFTQSVTAENEPSTASVGDMPTIKGLPDPTEDTEAATKHYVDTSISALDAGTVAADVTQLKTDVATNKGDIAQLKTDVAAAQSTATTANTAAQTAAGTANAAKTTADGALQRSGGTMTGGLILQSTPPSADYEAVPKIYADAIMQIANTAQTEATAAKTVADSANASAAAAQTTANGALQRSGGTMTGDLILNRDAVNNLGAVTLQQLNNLFKSFSITKNSDSNMTGTLNLTAHLIGGLVVIARSQSGNPYLDASTSFSRGDLLFSYTMETIPISGTHTGFLFGYLTSDTNSNTYLLYSSVLPNTIRVFSTNDIPSGSYRIAITPIIFGI